MATVTRLRTRLRISEYLARAFSRGGADGTRDRRSEAYATSIRPKCTFAGGFMAPAQRVPDELPQASPEADTDDRMAAQPTSLRGSRKVWLDCAARQNRARCKPGPTSVWRPSAPVDDDVCALVYRFRSLPLDVARQRWEA